jgi:aminopeptidase N
LYFKRHDGQAVIIEDFARAISDANNQDWDQFKLWYSQAGTPQVSATESFVNGEYKLSLEQSCPPSPGQPSKKAFHIPLEIELFDTEMKALSLNKAQINSPNSLADNSENKHLLHLKNKTAELKITGLSSKPIASLNRNFSAPIDLQFKRVAGELERL